METGRLFSLPVFVLPVVLSYESRNAKSVAVCRNVKISEFLHCAMEPIASKSMGSYSQT